MSSTASINFHCTLVHVRWAVWQSVSVSHGGAFLMHYINMIQLQYGANTLYAAINPNVLAQPLLGSSSDQRQSSPFSLCLDMGSTVGRNWQVTSCWSQSWLKYQFSQQSAYTLDVYTCVFLLRFFKRCGKHVCKDSMCLIANPSTISHLNAKLII